MPDKYKVPAANASIGPLTESTCTPKAWLILNRMMAIAEAANSPFASSLHFFWSFLQDDENALILGLRRSGIMAEALRDSFEALMQKIRVPQRAKGFPMLSASLDDLLLLAHTNALTGARDTITDEDLLLAFVRQGGGETGKILRAAGIVPDALISDLLTDKGKLNLAKIDKAVQQILSDALSIAQIKGHRALGRRHLLYGMLKLESGVLAKKLADQEADAESLADLLSVSDLMPPMDPIPSRLTWSREFIAPSLLRLLCSAERLANEAGQESLSELALLKACVSDGLSESGEFLIRNRVRFGKLGE